MSYKQRPDLTYLAVRRQLEGMRCESYEVGIYDREAGKMLPRVWTREQVLKSVPFLKKKNADGLNIYIRPQGSKGLILLDDIGLGTLDQMDREGLNPAAIIETSPQNYQAWVRLSLEPIPTEVATAAAKLLAERYKGDPASADWRHYGRLAGFTNCKPEYNRPFVHSHRCNGQMAVEASKLIAEAIEISEWYKSTPKPVSTIQRSSKSKIDPMAFYRQDYDRLLVKFPNPDESSFDYMIACNMLRKGYSTTEVEEAIRQGSPDLDTRKKGHVEDYITRTVQKAATKAAATPKPPQKVKR
ncbi:RepB family DNA primase [Gloeocapsa sp. BRSZ]